MVGIIDYGMGNLLSVFHAFEMVGEKATICSNPLELEAMDRFVLPGVGAFGSCINNLKVRGFQQALNDEILGKKKPILGICLGMQVMATKGYEGGSHLGLGWIDGEVVPLEPSASCFRVPHVGWNNISYDETNPLFTGLPKVCDMYFVHSFYMKCPTDESLIATSNHGGDFTAAIQKGNIMATQFHPEKSQENGLKVIGNFLNWEPR